LQPPSGQNLLSLLDPASQPYVVSVGGTTIDNATQPPSERVWNDGPEWGSGGGGVSESWTMPTWQEPVALTSANNTDVANGEAVEKATAAQSAPLTTPTFCDGTVGLPAGTPCRETPDVSAQADEFTGAVTIYGQSPAYGANGWVTIGGTSSASPIWASMLALVNASSSCATDIVNHVQDAGFASPILYGIAANSTAYAASFNDITAGNNDVYGLDNGLVYPAHAGYDMASGLGSPQLTSPSDGIGLAFYMCEYGAQLHPPTVTVLNPISGTVSGGEVVTVSGTGFGTSSHPAVAIVEVGGGHAVSFSVLDSTTLKVTLPPASTTTPAGSPNPTEDGAGPAPIVVTLYNGESSVPSASSLFEFVDESSSKTFPSVTSVSPFGGSDTSPATVTLFGSGFATCPAGTSGASCSASLTSQVTSVEFGGVAASDVVVVSPFELTATPPPFSALNPTTACPTDNGASGQSLNPADDVCQVEVTVTTLAGTSKTSAILAPYEGPEAFDAMGGEILPVGCGCESEPQTTEYDYVPAPTITDVSTGTVADLPANAADLASEYGGSPSNIVVVNGTGMDPLTFEYALLGSPINEDAIYYPMQLSGTSMILFAPEVLSQFGGASSSQPYCLPVGFASLAGQSNDGSIVYAGVPQINAVTNTANSRNVDGVDGAPASGGAPLDINGSGFLQTVGPISFVDNITGLSLGTQYNFAPISDSDVTTQSVSQNPALVDLQLCTETSCNNPSSFNSPPSTADELIIYPPGAPAVTSVSPASGPAGGGTAVVLSGENLGCVLSVSFGSVIAESSSNEQTYLLCGTTGLVDATSPAGSPSTKVPVTVTTAESVLTGDNPTSTATFSYTGLPGSPVITSANAATALVGSTFSIGVVTTGKATIRLSEQGPLPRGVGFFIQPDGSARLRGTPALGTGGVYYFTLMATNKLGSTTQSFVLTVNEAPSFQVASFWYLNVGAPTTFVVTTLGYPQPTVGALSTLPAGLNSSLGDDGLLVFSGTPLPGSGGKYNLTISATNSIGTANKDIIIVVG
jgi:hypothetical protein